MERAHAIWIAKCRALAVLIICGWIIPAYAIDLSVQGTMVTVTYTEPMALQTSRPLNDLIYTTVYPVWRQSGENRLSLPPIQVSSSSPYGGSLIQYSFPATPVAGYSVLEVSVTATREIGVESGPSRSVYVVIQP